MADKNADHDAYDIFVVEKVFPDPLSVLTFAIPSIESIRDLADVVVDTNVLLLPYTTGSNSLESIRQIYASLQSANRLFVPAQVAREFARNRPNKIGEILTAVNQKRSLVQQPAAISYPLVMDSKEYQQVAAREVELKASIRAYQEALGSLVGVIKEGGWADPVTQIYSKTFGANTIVSHKTSQKDLRSELEYRTRHDRPPAYKDAGKDDGGIGDLQIWHTILWLGEQRKKPLVFVTGDEKADWQYRADGRGYLPRYELVDEYRRASQGQPFYIVPFSRFLELFDASKVVVTEIREQERPEAVNESVRCPECSSEVRSMLGVDTGSSAFPGCGVCGTRFHIHRSANGSAVVHLPFSRAEHNDGVQETVDCPNCGTQRDVWIGEKLGSSAKPHCSNCDNGFHAHRGRDGMVFVRSFGQGREQ